MGVQNVKNCKKAFGNTGVGDCYNDVGIPRAILKVPKGKEFDSTTVSALKTALEAAILANVPSQRVFPIQGIVEVTSNTGQETIQTFNSTGNIAVNFEPSYDLTFRWTDGGFCLLHALRKSNRQNISFMIIDSFGQLIATQGSTPDTIKGIEGYNYTAPFTWSVAGDNVTGYNTRLNFRPEQVNEDIAIIDFSDDGGLGYLTGLSGLFDVVLSQGAARAAGVLNVKAKTDCGSVDMYDLYATELGVTGAWKVTNKTTGNDVAITGVATNPNIKGWTITVNTADPDYTATAGGLLVSLAAPADLAALDVEGYESNTLAQ